VIDEANPEGTPICWAWISPPTGWRKPCGGSTNRPAISGSRAREVPDIGPASSRVVGSRPGIVTSTIGSPGQRKDPPRSTTSIPSSGTITSSDTATDGGADPFPMATVSGPAPSGTNTPTTDVPPERAGSPSPNPNKYVSPANNG
jgi:hypothetical protein